MMTKSKSKQIKQLKYLLLVPVLASMLFYTACTQEKNEPEQKKENTVMYYNIKEMKKRVSDTESSYMDMYMGVESPNTRELKLSDLTNLELSEFNKTKDKFKENGREIVLKIFEGFENKDRKMLFFDMKASLKKFKSDQKNTSIDPNNVPFSTLDKVPTFPGCTEGDKTCFNQSMAKFIQENFDAKLANKLNLPAGKKRIYVQFKINKEGNIIDINARAPHSELKAHAIEVAQKLPKMLPGEKDGKQVTTSYVLPITFVVE